MSFIFSHRLTDLKYNLLHGITVLKETMYSYLAKNILLEHEVIFLL